MWDLPRPGLEPVSPALAGRFSTTAPPGKPNVGVFNEKVRNHFDWKGNVYMGEMSCAFLRETEERKMN